MNVLKGFYDCFLKTLKEPVTEPYQVLAKRPMGFNTRPCHRRKEDQWLWCTWRQDQDRTMGFNDPYLGYKLFQNHSWYCPCSSCLGAYNATDFEFSSAHRPNYNLIIPIDKLNLNARM